LLYYDVERVKLRLQSEEDELEDAENLLSDDEDVERSSPEEVRKWVDDYAAAKAAASQRVRPGGGRHSGIFRPRAARYIRLFPKRVHSFGGEVDALDDSARGKKAIRGH
jgi:hypothetical protein